MKKTKRMYFLRSLQVILFDEAGQVADEVIDKIDIMISKVINNNIYMGGVLIISSMDHSQIQPIRGRPFLTSCHIVPCFKMVPLENSI